MKFTALHRALGLEPTPLAHQVIDAAVEERVEEADDLDWERDLPTKERDAEFAKDVAAMANSGGGLIVYGVDEMRGSGTSGASEVSGVTGWDDGVEQRLRQVADNQIRPAVVGLVFEVVRGTHSDVVALQVPASPDAPHLVYDSRQFNSFRVPRRYGAHTQEMSERDIERAYRARFEARGTHEEAVRSALESISAGIDLAGRADEIGPRPWLIAVARPMHPRTLLDLVHQLSLDVVNQGGITDLTGDYLVPRPLADGRAAAA